MANSKTTRSAKTESTTTTVEEAEKSLQDELSHPLLLTDRVIKSTHEADSNRADCADLSRQLDRLAHKLRTLVRISTTTASSSVYERPVRRIAADVTKNLDRALSLVRKCKRHGVLRQLFSIISSADFRKVSSLLESSIGDLIWLIAILESPDGTVLSLPPIVSNDPIVAWVWSLISTIQNQTGQLDARVEAANGLASLARDNERNKKIIVEEGGIVPLLKLLKDGASPEAQIAAANALSNIGTDPSRVRLIASVMGIPIIVAVLGNSPMKVQTVVANLVAKMAELDPIAQEDFVRENVTKPLVSLLSMDLVLEVPKVQTGNNINSIHSLVQMNKELAEKALNKASSNSDGSSRGGHHGSHHYRKERERELESPQVKLQVQINCAEALWKLSRNSLSNSRKITETKGLLCLAKHIEKNKGELQYNCLMAIMEITVVATDNADLRRAAFKTNSPAAKAVLDQLLRVILEEESSTLKVPAIKSIGCLARTFPARESRIIGPLVSQMGHTDLNVAIATVIALGKFVSPENFNCSEHSKAIIEFEGVPALMRLIRLNDQAQVHGLVLLCYLALNAGNSKALEQARALNTLEGAARSVIAQYPDKRDLFAKAIHTLTLFQSAGNPHRQSFVV